MTVAEFKAQSPGIYKQLTTADTPQEFNRLTTLFSFAAKYPAEVNQCLADKTAFPQHLSSIEALNAVHSIMQSHTPQSAAPISCGEGVVFISASTANGPSGTGVYATVNPASSSAETAINNIVSGSKPSHDGSGVYMVNNPAPTPSETYSRLMTAPGIASLSRVD